MYVAGRLEAAYVLQYADAREHALACGRKDYAEQLVAMIKEEDRHEQFFGDRIRDHRLLPIGHMVGGWTPPPPSEPVI